MASAGKKRQGNTGAVEERISENSHYWEALTTTGSAYLVQSYLGDVLMQEWLNRVKNEYTKVEIVSLTSAAIEGEGIFYCAVVEVWS